MAYVRDLSVIPYLSWRTRGASWWTPHSWGSRTWTWARPWSAGPHGGHSGQSGPLWWLGGVGETINPMVTITGNLRFMSQNAQVTCYHILLAHLRKQGVYLLLDNHIFYFYQLVAVFELSIVCSKLLLLELHFTGSIHRVFFGSLILNWMGLCLCFIQIFFCWL